MTTRVLKHPIAILVVVAMAALVKTPARAFDGVMPVPPGGPHIFAPGPRGLGLQGPQANPSSVGDFDGTVALAYLKGRAKGGDEHHPHGERHAHHERRLLAADGSRHHGSFAFIEFGLYEARYGLAASDFTGGVLCSGLVWTVRSRTSPSC
jgi:hypothetical protein